MSSIAPFELKQKNQHEIREFFLEPNRMRLITKNINGEDEFYVNYESMTTTTRSIIQQNGRIYVIANLFGVLTFIGLAASLAKLVDLTEVTLYLAAAAIMSFWAHFQLIRRYFVVDLYDKKSIFFIAKKPSPEQLTGFITAMFEARKKFLREKYYVITPENNPNEEIAKFKWLLKDGLISESEFQAIKTSLDSLNKRNNIHFQNKGPIN